MSVMMNRRMFFRRYGVIFRRQKAQKNAGVHFHFIVFDVHIYHRVKKGGRFVELLFALSVGEITVIMDE